MAFVVCSYVHGARLLAHGYDAALGISTRDADELFRLGVGKRNQKNSVYKAENSSVGPDAESECQNGNGGKTGRFAQSTKGKVEIRKQSFQKWQTAGVAVLLLGLLVAAKAEKGFTARFRRGKTVLKIFFDGEFEMRRHFSIEVAVEFRATEEGAQLVK